MIRKIFKSISKKSILAAKEADSEFSKIWDLSLKIIPDTLLGDHFVCTVLTDEAKLRMRYLICGEVFFSGGVIKALFSDEKHCSCLDVGDCDGAMRLLLREYLRDFSLDSLGINLQLEAVEKIRQKGLPAECIDAMEFGKTGREYDIVSIFETLEHLPNPLGFLENIHGAVRHRLIISVPFVHQSRVSLRYLDKNWDKNKVPTIENTHIFELSPLDWDKIFRHTGWRIEQQWRLEQFPKSGFLRLIMQQAWKKISFGRFWFVCLTKDMTYQKRFRIE